MKIILFCIYALISIAVAACARRRGSEEIVVGGLYASKNEDGAFTISKVLAVDDFAVHVRIYKNKFSSLPENLDSSVLALGKFADGDGFGIGHAPIAKRGWLTSEVFLKREPVREEELEGYKYYLEEMRKK